MLPLSSEKENEDEMLEADYLGVTERRDPEEFNYLKFPAAVMDVTTAGSFDALLSRSQQS